MASQANVSPATNAFVPTSGNAHRIDQPDMRNMALSIFHRRTAMTDDHWKQVGALLQKANEERMKVIYQEPLAGPPGSMKPASRIAQRTSGAVPEGSCALLRPIPRQ
ncbi:MAG: hypothetical protein J0M01_10335 [Dechloromonas sp.]|jgi:hypothetical protein|nr:hypothetical protein [Dechloromonas sp.]